MIITKFCSKHQLYRKKPNKFSNHSIHRLNSNKNTCKKKL